MKNKAQVCYQLDNKDIIYLEKFGQVMIILFSAYSMSQTFSISALANTKFYKRIDLSSHKAAWFSSPPLQKKKSSWPRDIPVFPVTGSWHLCYIFFSHMYLFSWEKQKKNKKLTLVPVPFSPILTQNPTILLLFFN